MSDKGSQVLHLACQGRRLSPLPPRQLRHWQRALLPLDFEIQHFPIKYLAKKVVLVVSSG